MDKEHDLEILSIHLVDTKNHFIFRNGFSILIVLTPSLELEGDPMAGKAWPANRG